MPLKSTLKSTSPYLYLDDWQWPSNIQVLFLWCLRLAQKLHFPHLSHHWLLLLIEKMFLKVNNRIGKHRGQGSFFAMTCLFYLHFHLIIFMFCDRCSGFPNIFFKDVWKAALKWYIKFLVNDLTCSLFCITHCWLWHGCEEYSPMKNTVFITSYLRFSF